MFWPFFIQCASCDDQSADDPRKYFYNVKLLISFKPSKLTESCCKICQVLYGNIFNMIRRMLKRKQLRKISRVKTQISEYSLSRQLMTEHTAGFFCYYLHKVAVMMAKFKRKDK